MPRNSIGSWFLKCPNCGHEYRITNYGRRQARRARRSDRPDHRPRGRLPGIPPPLQPGETPVQGLADPRRLP